MDKLKLIVLLFFAIIQVEIVTIVVDKVNLKNNINDLTKRVIDFINKWENTEQEELKTDLEYIINTDNPYQE